MQPLKITRKPVEQAVVDDAIDAIVAAIVNVGPVEEVYLFGSAASGKMTDQSDIDLLVVCPDRESIRPMQKKLRNLPRLTQFPVDLVWIDRDAFDHKKSIGGICFVAYHDGIRKFPAAGA